MTAADLSPPLIARLESEVLILRQRAEDAEADLAEARRELALETERADAAERELAQLLASEERQPGADGSPVPAAVQTDAPPSLVDRPEVTAIAAELIALMAKNDQAAAPPPKKRQKAK